MHSITETSRQKIPKNSTTNCWKCVLPEQTQFRNPPKKKETTNKTKLSVPPVATTTHLQNYFKSKKSNDISKDIDFVLLHK